jgi:hypothetical protein
MLKVALIMYQVQHDQLLLRIHGRKILRDVHAEVLLPSTHAHLPVQPFIHPSTEILEIRLRRDTGLCISGFIGQGRAPITSMIPKYPLSEPCTARSSSRLL